MGSAAAVLASDVLSRRPADLEQNDTLELQTDFDACRAWILRAVCGGGINELVWPSM